jgi:AraC-like DNA-binding protein
VSVQSKGNWSTLNQVTAGMLESEVEYGVEHLRWPHNDRMIEAARRKNAPVLAELFGFFDLCVPIEVGTSADSFLVAGPFARTRPSSVEIADRWHRIAKARPNLADPSFARYLGMTLGALTLDDAKLAAFERLLSCMALLLRNQGEAEALAKEVAALNTTLLQARASERLWEAARSMVDERTSHVWRTPIKRDPLQRLGIEQPPEHALVGLITGSEEVKDPLADLLRRRAFQSAMTELAYEHGSAASGQVADHGVSLLVASIGGPSAARTALVELARRSTAVARRFGFGLCVGIAPAQGSQSLAERYRAALGAAERALARGTSVVFAETRAEPSARHLGRLRSRLAEGIGEHEGVLSTRFERYAEAAAVHANYRAELVAAHLEAGLERLAEPLLASGQLDRRNFEELCRAVEQAPGSDSTVAGVIADYRGVVVDIERAISSPTAARHGRSRRRAVAFMRENLGKPITLQQVSKVAGFAPYYFSRLLKAEEGVTFERYLQTLRLGRAKETLAGTSLPIGRVAELSGFKSRTYFQRIFRETTGVTPIEYRKSVAI